MGTSVKTNTDTDKSKSFEVNSELKKNILFTNTLRKWKNFGSLHTIAIFQLQYNQTVPTSGTLLDVDAFNHYSSAYFQYCIVFLCTENIQRQDTKIIGLENI